METLAFVAFRAVHVLIAALWIGSTVFVSALLVPAVEAAGPAGGRVMQSIVRRGINLYMGLLGGATVLTGLYLLWRFTGGLIRLCSRPTRAWRLRSEEPQAFSRRWSAAGSSAGAQSKSSSSWPRWKPGRGTVHGHFDRTRPLAPAPDENGKQGHYRASIHRARPDGARPLRMMRFRDRRDAGRQLAVAVARALDARLHARYDDVVVLALPRGAASSPTRSQRTFARRSMSSWSGSSAFRVIPSSRWAPLLRPVSRCSTIR